MSIDWNQRYADGDTPWDSGSPDLHLVRFVEAWAREPSARVLEIGCGTGTNAVWLAERGLEVVAVDLSALAVERAEARAASSSSEPGVAARCRFQQLDFLSGELPTGRFDLVFDRGVFHVFDDADDRIRFAARVATVLAPGGRWASLMGSTEGPPRDTGPPRRSVRDVATAIEPSLAVEELREVPFAEDIAVPAWWCVARRRDVPAQPSTRREA